MAANKRATEECFDTIIIDMHPQALTDQLQRRAVKDALDQKATGPGDWNNRLGEVGGPPLWQWLEVNPLRLDGIGPLPVAQIKEFAPPADRQSAGSPRWMQSHGCRAGSAPVQ